MSTNDILKSFEESAERHFANFVPSYRKLDGIEILDWRNQNGSGSYRVHYVFDTQEQKLYVSGDLGCGIFALTWKPTLENTAPEAQFYGYMLEKLESGCSSDYYKYDEQLAREELEERFNEHPDAFAAAKRAVSVISNTVVPTAIIDAIMTGFTPSCGIDASDLTLPAGTFLRVFDDDYNRWLNDIGKTIHPRVVFWLVGLRKAWGIIKTEQKNHAAEQNHAEQ